VRISQVVLGLIVAVACALTLVRYRAGRIRLVSFALWSSVWLAALVAVLVPETTSLVAGWLNIGRGADAVVYLGILLSFYLLFRIYEKLERVERDITAIVRHLALTERK